MGIFARTADTSHNGKALHEIEVSLVIIRADGTVEDLGVTDYYHRNPLRRWAFLARKKLGIRKEPGT